MDTAVLSKSALDQFAELSAQLLKDAHARLEDARTRRAVAERDAQAAQTEIAALVKVMNVLSKTKTPAAKGRGHKISKAWQHVLREMAKQEESKYEEIYHYCGEAGMKNIKRNALRSQMSNYMKRGLVIKLRDGVLQVTP